MIIKMNNENRSPRKEVIKNIAIVFLAVLLVLTFFSNTFMNYTLPQVSAVYVSQGTISEQIRGSGTVEAAESYEVKFDQTRTIKSVAVKTGQTINAGDTLFELEDSDRRIWRTRSLTTKRQFLPSPTAPSISPIIWRYRKPKRSFPSFRQSIRLPLQALTLFPPHSMIIIP